MTAIIIPFWSATYRDSSFPSYPPLPSTCPFHAAPAFLHTLNIGQLFALRLTRPRAVDRYTIAVSQLYGYPEPYGLIHEESNPCVC